MELEEWDGEELAARPVDRCRRTTQHTDAKHARVWTKWDGTETTTPASAREKEWNIWETSPGQIESTCTNARLDSSPPPVAMQFAKRPKTGHFARADRHADSAIRHSALYYLSDFPFSDPFLSFSSLLVFTWEFLMSLFAMSRSRNCVCACTIDCWKFYCVGRYFFVMALTLRLLTAVLVRNTTKVCVRVFVIVLMKHCFSEIWCVIVVMQWFLVLTNSILGSYIFNFFFLEMSNRGFFLFFSRFSWFFFEFSQGYFSILSCFGYTDLLMFFF